MRPTRILPGIDAPLKRCKPEDLNWVIVRENSGGEYSGVGGRAPGHPIEAATDVSIMTRAGVERILRFAFAGAVAAAAQAADRDHQEQRAAPRDGDVGPDRRRGRARVPDVRWDKELVDAATARMVNRPASLDTIVATNLHADILSDPPPRWPAASASRPPATSIRSAAIRDVRADPRLGLRHHGPGPGQSGGHLLVCVMLLEHLGEHGAASS